MTIMGWVARLLGKAGVREGEANVGKIEDAPRGGHTHDENGPRQPFDKNGKPGGYHTTCSKCGMVMGTVTF